MDQVQRKAFCTDIESNFSVIAPAGVGKTSVITERIYSIASKEPGQLANLYVITYTKKAAESLRARAQKRLQEHPEFCKFEHFFHQSFFGTIHSLCWQHIRQFEMQRNYEIIQDDTFLKHQFLAIFNLNEDTYKNFEHILRFTDLDTLPFDFEFLSNEPIAHIETNSFLDLDLSPIYNFEPEQRNKSAVELTKSLLNKWENDYIEGKFLSLPECFIGGEKFKQVYYKTFKPLFERLSSEALQLSKIVSEAYYQFRLQQGYLKHADLIRLAQQCLSKSTAKKFFKHTPVSILLDEAQDTDPHQFQYLQELIQLNYHNKFSMVGDPQQAIYSSRADVKHYLKLHKALTETNFCKELIFAKTFRCPQTIVEIVNKKFPKILCTGIDKEQVDFVPLISAKDEQGSFQCIHVPDINNSEIDPETYEIDFLSQFLKQHLVSNPTKLSNICLLAPRKDWLNKISGHLNKLGWPTQLYSSNITGRDNPFFCNILAFIHIINFPNDSFEIAGMLVNTFGITEAQLTLYEKKLTISSINFPDSIIDEALNELYQLRQKSIEMSLWNGIERIIEFFKHKCPPNEADEDAFIIILKSTLQAQSNGASWASLEQYLRQYLTTTINSEPALNPDAIQCYTCHKAKGLEWDIVIVPYFYHPIRHAPYKYPLIHNDKIFWNKYDSDLQKDLNQARKREIQRLLYVTFTRAKNHLIILDDRHLWKDESNSPSFGNLYAEDF